MEFCEIILMKVLVARKLGVRHTKLVCLTASFLLLLHSAFILSDSKMLLKGEVGGHALNSLGNYIVDHGKS